MSAFQAWQPCNPFTFSEPCAELWISVTALHLLLYLSFAHIALPKPLLPCPAQAVSPKPITCMAVAEGGGCAAVWLCDASGRTAALSLSPGHTTAQAAWEGGGAQRGLSINVLHRLKAVLPGARNGAARGKQLLAPSLLLPTQKSHTHLCWFIWL